MNDKLAASVIEILSIKLKYLLALGISKHLNILWLLLRIVFSAQYLELDRVQLEILAILLSTALCVDDLH